MGMIRVFILASAMSFFGFCFLHAQVPQIALRSESSLRKNADLYFEREAYSHAAKLYHRIVIKYPEDNTVQLKLADCYRFLREPGNAAYWYGHALAKDQQISEHTYHYATVLAATKQYEKAKSWYQKYLTHHPEDQRSINAISSLKNAKLLFDSRYQVKPLKIKLPGAIFSPSLFENGLVVVGEGNTGTLVKKITTWTEGPFYDLYYVPLKEDGTPGYPKYLDNQLNSVYHEGPSIFFDDGKRVIFTRSNFRKGNEHTRNLKLMIAERKPSGNWSSPSKLFQHPDYSIGHPAINAAGTVIYFASNMPGGYGGSDIYTSTLRDGVWQQPVNAGPKINTSGNELFPSIDEHGNLYFSSDGHGGLGGLDIFKTDHQGQGQPFNIGYPINSQGDDFSLVWKRNSSTGYFSSNRSGIDKIYEVTGTDQSVNTAVPFN